MKARRFVPVILLATSLQASILPLQQLDQNAVREFEKYVENWENGPNLEFTRNGHMWIDSTGGSHRKDFESQKPVLEFRLGTNVAGGHIHHLFGTVRIPNMTLERVLKTVENYAKYPEYFNPDVVRSTATLQPDSTDAEQHFRISMELVQATMWFDIALHGNYDAHYRRLDSRRVTTRSRSLNLIEYRDAHNRAEGTYPEGHDHGLLWRTYTSWHIRERDGGVDMEVNSISLTRPIPAGLGWWAARKAKESVEKMVNRTRAAILSAKPAQIAVLSSASEPL